MSLTDFRSIYDAQVKIDAFEAWRAKERRRYWRCSAIRRVWGRGRIGDETAIRLLRQRKAVDRGTERGVVDIWIEARDDARRHAPTPSLSGETV